MSKRLIVCGTLDQTTGWGIHMSRVVSDFVSFGHEVAVRPVSVAEPFNSSIPEIVRQRLVTSVQPEPWELIIHYPNIVPTAGKHTVYFTMAESTKLTEDQVNFINKANVVVVPCRWNSVCFRDSGIKSPIFVVPLGFNENVFKPSKTRMKGTCVFGTAGRLIHGVSRKGCNHVIECFLKAFPGSEDVSLVVKGFPDCALNKVVDPRITFIQEYLSEEQMAAYLSSLTCFVSAARGEGFGLIQLEACAVGRPVIASVFGGLSDFLGKTNCYNIPYTIEDANERYTGKGQWAIPSQDHIIAAMRHVYEHRKEAASIGRIAHESVKHLTWTNSNRALEAVLHSCGVIGYPKTVNSFKSAWTRRTALVVNPLVKKPAGKTISAIVCVYNTKTERLNKCLNALLPYVEEVILSVDGDGVEPDHVQNPKIKVVNNTSGSRVGYGRTANKGVKISTGDWLLLINDDVYVNDRTIPMMLDAASEPGIAAVGCLLRYPNGLINHGGIFRAAHGRNFGHIDYHAITPTITKVTEMEAVTLGCSLIRKDAFDQVEGFDEEFDCYYEDMDLCMKLRQDGWKIVYTPFAEAIHEESQTSNSLGTDFKRQKLMESGIIMERKWGWYYDLNRTNLLGVF